MPNRSIHHYWPYLQKSSIFVSCFFFILVIYLHEIKRKKKRGEESQTEINVYIKAKQTNREKKERDVGKKTNCSDRKFILSFVFRKEFLFYDKTDAVVISVHPCA